MIPPPRPPQRIPGPAGPASSPPPWPPRATVAARWPGQASNPGWSLHRGLGRLAWRLLFAPQPHHPPAGNAIPQHQQHHPRCLPQQVVPHRKQRAGHRYYRAAHQQPDRVALLAAGFQVGSGHGSSPSQRGTVRRWRWPDHQVAPMAPSGVKRRPRHAPTAVLPWVLMARPLRGGPTQRPRHGKERWRGVGVAGACPRRGGPSAAPAGPGRAGHAARPACCCSGRAVTGPHGLPARIDLPASLPAGALHPAGPVDPSTAGLPPRTLRGQGLSARQQPPARHTLTAPGPTRPGDSRSPEAGEDRCPPVEGASRGSRPGGDAAGQLALRDRGGTPKPAPPKHPSFEPKEGTARWQIPTSPWSAT
jgi:hypothetical protein